MIAQLPSRESKGLASRNGFHSIIKVSSLYQSLNWLRSNNIEDTDDMGFGDQRKFNYLCS